MFSGIRSEVGGVIKRNVEKYPEKPEALARSWEEVKGLKCFKGPTARYSKSWLEALEAFARDHLGDLVDDERHNSNKVTRKELGAYNVEMKLKSPSKELAMIHKRNMLETFYINGTVLGNVRPMDLLKSAKKDRATAETHLGDALFKENLYRAIPPTKLLLTIREAVDEETVVRIFRESHNKVPDAAS